MKIIIPEKSMLIRTNDVDYYHWNYEFPIKYIQLYRFKTITNLLGNKIYPRLLETGTGSGIFLPELARHCEKLYASDIHPHFENIEPLLKAYQVKDFELKSQSIEKTDYPDDFFDAIVAVSVLEFVEDLKSAINEIKRILKKDGVFLTICPMHNKLLDLIVSKYADKSAKEEFGDSRLYVRKALEQNFITVRKGYLLPIIGKFFPVYTHYKLKKQVN
jgi:ubiquinone/menaquinone biosynthesis C-methylase UbiE